MKKTIKVKVKTLLILAACLSMLLFWADDIFWLGIKAINTALPYDKQVKLDTMKPSSITGENYRLELLLSENNYMLYSLVSLSEYGCGGNVGIRGSDAEIIYQTFQKHLLTEDLYKKYPNYVLNVAITQWISGQMEHVDELLKNVNLEEWPKRNRDQYRIIKSAMALTFNRLDEVNANLMALEEQRYFKVRLMVYDYLKTAYHFPVPKEVSGKYVFSESDDKYIHFFSDLVFLTDALKANAETTDMPEKISDKRKKVALRCTVKGKPFQGLIIYEKKNSGLSSREINQTNWAVTDETGLATLIVSDDFRYGFGVLAPFQLVYNKQWKNISHSGEISELNFEDGVVFSDLYVRDGKLHYTIKDPLANPDRSYYLTGGYTDPAFQINVVSKYAILPLEMPQGSISLKKLQANSTLPFLYSGSGDELNWTRFMETFYLRGEYSLGISVSERMKNINNGLFTTELDKTVIIPGEPALNIGDELLKASKVEEAMTWYAANPSGHNTKVLAALYSRGYKVSETIDDYTQVLEGRDLDQAIRYTEELIGIYGEEEVFFTALVQLYKEKRDYDSQEALLERHLSITEDPYSEESLAVNWIQQGRYLEGTELLSKAQTANDSAKWNVSYFLLGNQLQHLSKDVADRAAIIHKSVPAQFFTFVQSGRYEEALGFVQGMKAGDLKDYLTLLMLDVLDTETVNFELYLESNQIESDKDYMLFYTETVEAMSDVSIQNLLKRVKKDNNWFFDGE